LAEFAALLACDQPDEVGGDAGKAADADQAVHFIGKQIHAGSRPGMPGHADAQHEEVAEPKGKAGEKADLGDVDG